MIRAVLDTNILVSALLQPLGPSARILTLALNGAIQLCVSGNVYAEYDEVLHRPRFRLSEPTIQSALEAIRLKSYWVRDLPTIRACSDPDDDIFLECASAARADYLVTGNLKDFPGIWRQTKIFSPRSFLENEFPGA